MRFIPATELNNRWRCTLTGRTSDPEGAWQFDTTVEWLTPAGQMQTDTQVYVCQAAAKELARRMGWHSPEEIEKIAEAHRAQGAELEALKTRLDDLAEFKRLEKELVA